MFTAHSRSLTALFLAATVANAQTELGQLVDPNARRQDQLGGGSIAVDGDLVLMGVPKADYMRRGEYSTSFGSYLTDWSKDAGAAYLFDRSTGALVHIWRPESPFGWSNYGTNVALHGSIAVISRHKQPVHGRALVYDVTTGEKLFELSHPGTGFGFGWSVALDDTYIVVGGPRINEDGSVGIFSRATGALIRTIDSPTQPGTALLFGSSLALDGDHLLVGAAGSHFQTHKGGRAHLFNVHTGALLTTFAPSDAHTYMYFGRSVGLEGDRVVVGAPEATHGGWANGAAYLFDATSGAQLALLRPDTPDPYMFFGKSLTLENGRVLVGCPGETGGAALSGRVYAYSAQDGSPLGSFWPSDTSASDMFGSALAAQGDVAVIGAEWAATSALQSGKAYVFDVSDL